MARAEKAETLGFWVRVSRAVFPHVRRDQLEDVASRAWATWLMNKKRPPVCTGIIARRRVVDAARLEWGRKYQTMTKLARTTEFLPERHSHHDVPHEDTEEFVIGLESRGVNHRCRIVACMLVRGLLQHEIASQLGVSEATVSADLERLRKRFADMNPEHETPSQDPGPLGFDRAAVFAAIDATFPRRRKRR